MESTPTMGSISKKIMIATIIAFILSTTKASKFTIINNCHHTIWPGILSSAGSPSLSTTGFVLPSGATRTLPAPTGWSGRLWARTGCRLSSTNHFSCLTADCGSGAVECAGAGAAPPATLAEFTLASSSGLDFYDVSLVDGYNLPVAVDGAGCESTGCAADLNSGCPSELSAGAGTACRSACEAFGKDEYCCSGAYGNPDTCRPSVYSQIFKKACPKAYSYAYDDGTSTFTCKGGAYVITFCPASSSHGLKSSTDPSSSSDNSSDTNPNTSSDTNPTLSSSSDPYPPRTTTASAATMADNDAWLAALASGDSSTLTTTVTLNTQVLITSATTTSLLFLLL